MFESPASTTHPSKGMSEGSSVSPFSGMRTAAAAPVCGTMVLFRSFLPPSQLPMAELVPQSSISAFQQLTQCQAHNYTKNICVKGMKSPPTGVFISNIRLIIFDEMLVFFYPKSEFLCKTCHCVATSIEDIDMFLLANKMTS